MVWKRKWELCYMNLGGGGCLDQENYIFVTTYEKKIYTMKMQKDYIFY